LPPWNRRAARFVKRPIMMVRIWALPFLCILLKGQATEEDKEAAMGARFAADLHRQTMALADAETHEYIACIARYRLNCFSPSEAKPSWRACWHTQ